MKFLFAILMAAAVLSMQVNARQDSVSYTRLGIVTGTTAAGFLAGYALQKNMWWKGERSVFHSEWEYDWKYAKGADKIGHAFFPYLVTRSYTDLLTWCNLSEESSVWYSAEFALFYQTFIEVRDGFSKEWGFSWGDWTADVLGAGLPVLQYYNPSLKNFHLKISYYPSYRYRHNSNKYIMDDYESTFHWLSVDIRNMLPDNLQHYIPSFVGLALGHNVQGLEQPGGGQHELYISLDWNLEKIGTDSDLLKKILKLFNHYHLPAPAIKIYPRFTGILLKF